MCGITCLKIVIGIINAIFLLAGALMLAFGIVALVKPGLIIELFTQSADFLDNIGDVEGINGLLKGVGIFMIVLGGVVFIFAFFGLFGACCENNCMLITFVILLFIVLLAEIALILVGAFAEDIVESTVKKGISNFIYTRFEGGLSIVNSSAHFPENLPASSTWESFQLFFRCCGVNDSSDYLNAEKWSKTVSINGMSKDAVVPLSCCKITGGDSDFVDPKVIKQDSFTDIDKCLINDATYINSKDCYDKTKDLITDYAKIAIGIAAGICGIELIMIVLTIVLIVLIRNNRGKIV